MERLFDKPFFLLLFKPFFLLIFQMLESETAPCRILLPHDDFSRISITDLKEQWKNQERYIDWLESKHAATAVGKIVL